MDPQAMEHPLNSIVFDVLTNYDSIPFTEEEKYILSQPSHLTDVLLCSNWKKQTYRCVDFRNTTNEQTIRKILTFYTHTTYRRLMEDNIFFEGFHEIDGNLIVMLGS